MRLTNKNKTISIITKFSILIILNIIIPYTSNTYCQSKTKKTSLSSFSKSPLNLEALINFAVSNNLELKSMQNKWQAAKERAPQLKYLPDPRISYGYFTEEVQTKTGPQEHKFAISQTIPWLEKLTLKEKIASKEADAVYQDYLKTSLKLIQNIKTAFYEYAYLAHSVEINKQHLDLLKAMEHVANIRFKSGSLPQNNLIQLQMEQVKIEDKLKELETFRLPLSSKIYASIGIQSSEVLPWPETLKDEIPDIDTQTLNSLMFENNPSLKRTELLKEQENYNFKLADKNFYPDVTFSLERIDVDGGDDPMIAMFSVNLPIWWGKLNAAKRESMERSESLANSLTDQENQLSADLHLLIYQFQDAQRKARLYMNTLVPKAQQAINVALKGFETGKVNFADLIDAQRSLLEFQLTGKRQAANTYIRLAEIEKLIGKKLQLSYQNNEKE